MRESLRRLARVMVVGTAGLVAGVAMHVRLDDAWVRPVETYLLRIPLFACCLAVGARAASRPRAGRRLFWRVVVTGVLCAPLAYQGLVYLHLGVTGIARLIQPTVVQRAFMVCLGIAFLIGALALVTVPLARALESSPARTACDALALSAALLAALVVAFTVHELAGVPSDLASVVASGSPATLVVLFASWQVRRLEARRANIVPNESKGRHARTP